jgi:FkbM family methyltransferase
MNRKILSSKAKDVKLERDSLRGILRHVKRLGFKPTTIIDVGVNIGTPQLYDTFIESKYLLIDPLEENRYYMKKICNRLKNADYIIAAAAKYKSELVLHVHNDFAGSSLYRESDGITADGIQRRVKGIPLDGICEERSLQGPYIIKIDTQGNELNVLLGAEKILKETELIILETSLFQFHIDGPQFYDVVLFMKEHGFVVYDIAGTSFRPLDGAMSQVDLVFVKENGQFRKNHGYATRDQRKEIIAKLLKKRKRT